MGAAAANAANTRRNFQRQIRMFDEKGTPIPIEELDRAQEAAIKRRLWVREDSKKNPRLLYDRDTPLSPNEAYKLYPLFIEVSISPPAYRGDTEHVIHYTLSPDQRDRRHYALCRYGEVYYAAGGRRYVEDLLMGLVFGEPNKERLAKLPDALDQALSYDKDNSQYYIDGIYNAIIKDPENVRLLYAPLSKHGLLKQFCEAANDGSRPLPASTFDALQHVIFPHRFIPLGLGADTAQRQLNELVGYMNSPDPDICLPVLGRVAGLYGHNPQAFTDRVAWENVEPLLMHPIRKIRGWARAAAKEYMKDYEYSVRKLEWNAAEKERELKEARAELRSKRSELVRRQSLVVRSPK